MSAGLLLGAPARPRRSLPIAWTTVDVEGRQAVSGRRVRGWSQVTPVWGESVRYGQAFARAPGRAFAALLSLEDAAAGLALGWATTAPVGDPRADGHGLAVEPSAAVPGQPGAIVPGRRVVLDGAGRVLRPTRYLAVVVLDALGAYALLSGLGPAETAGGLGSADPIGIPAYPAARLLWAEPVGAAATLRPYVSAYDTGDGAGGYPPGLVVDDARVVDLPGAWAVQDGIAACADRFARADSAASLGTSSAGQAWTATRGTWGVLGGQGYLASDPGGVGSLATLPGPSDGVFRARVTVPASWTGSNAWFGLGLRRVDANNFVRVGNNGANQIVIQTWVAGAFGATIASTAQAWVAGQTYELVVLAQGSRYRVWIDGVDTFSAWQVDALGRHLAGTGFGPYGGLGLAASGAVRWDDLAAYPHVVGLPAALGRGAVPRALGTGATRASDGFGDADGTRLSSRASAVGGVPIEQAGTWTTAGGRAVCASGASANLLVWEAGGPDVEVRADVTAPATLSARGAAETGQVYAGVALRVAADGSGYVLARLRRDVDQRQNDEVELIVMVGGGPVPGAAGGIVRKANVRTAWNAGGAYRLRLAARGGTVLVYAGQDTGGDVPVLAWEVPPGVVLAGTRAGLYLGELDDGSAFDDALVRAT